MPLTFSKAFLPYVPLGFPTFDKSIEIIVALAENGAAGIELGVPFSDPLADGPVIQAATQTAITAGITVAKCFDIIAAVRARGVAIPLFLMSYANPLLTFGLTKVARLAHRSRLAGVILPDVPLEELPLFEAAFSADLPCIRLLAPTTPQPRTRQILANAHGFVYLVAVAGTTGGAAASAADLQKLVARVRPLTNLPLAVGFGIASPVAAAAALRHADGVIVGSALVRALQNAPNPAATAGEFAREYGAASAAD